MFNETDNNIAATLGCLGIIIAVIFAIPFSGLFKTVLCAIIIICVLLNVFFRFIINLIKNFFSSS